MSKTHNAGIVTAYGAAVRGGYTGTYEEFCAQQAQYAENARQMEQAVSDVRQIKTSVESAVSEAEGYANNANQSATNASNSATQASESASNANQSAESASQFADNASNSANSASQSATSAQTSATNASASEQSAHQSVEDAQDILESVQTEGDTQIGRVQAKGDEVLNSIPEDYTQVQNELAALNRSLGDIKAELTVSDASFFENARTNYPAVSYIHGASINVAGKIIADAGEIAFFSCVKGLTYKWNSLVRNRSYIAFYATTPEAGSTSYNDSRQSVSANTAFVAPITGICAVYYHAVTQTSEMKFWAVSDLADGLDNLAFKLKRTISKNLVGNESGVYYPVDIKAGVFNINVSTSDGSNFSQMLYLGLYDAQKNLIDGKIVLATTNSYRDVQENISIDVKYIMVEGTNAVPLMVTVSYNPVGGAVIYEPYFYDAKSLTKELHGIKYPDVPSYYETYIASKADFINELDNVDMQIGFITDEHYPQNAKNSPALLRYLWNNVPMNFIVNNGDVLVQEETKVEAMRKITQFNAQFDFAQNHYYPIVGNHEHNNSNGQSTSTQLSLAQVQLAVLSKKNNVQFSKFASYYVDDSLTECRYYFVGCKQNSGIYEEDLVWLLQSFKTIPNGYCVVLFSHNGLKYNSSYEVTGAQTGVSVLSMGLLAVANKSSYTYNHVVYNYSDVDAVPIAIFSGHVHFDSYYQYMNSNYDGYIYIIATTCDAYGTQPVGSVDRTAYTVNEQAFDIISVDRSNRIITMTRIGAGSDRTFTYSDYSA